MLIVKNIVKKFHGKKVIDDVSFDVAPGQIVVLLGQSGVGKSTILRVLSNLEAIDAGSMILDEQQIDFSKVGMVFQDFNLFAHLTVEQNLTLPLTVVAKKTEDDAKKMHKKCCNALKWVQKQQIIPCHYLEVKSNELRLRERCV